MVRTSSCSCSAGVFGLPLLCLSKWTTLDTKPDGVVHSICPHDRLEREGKYLKGSPDLLKLILGVFLCERYVA